jgi:ABC-type uncharacterized transport system auxiliary subunit
MNNPSAMSKEYSNQQMTKPAARARFWPFAILALGAAALCGCSSEAAWKSQNFAFALPGTPPTAGSKTNVVALRRVTISPLFQSHSFIYRMGENTYEHDPYAGFFIPPERAIEQPIRAWLQDGGDFGSVVEPGSALSPAFTAEVSVNELYGDFRKTGHPAGVLEIHFILYEISKGGPGRVLLDKVCANSTPMTKATPVALAAAWDADLRKIMAEINSDMKKLQLN